MTLSFPTHRKIVVTTETRIVRRSIFNEEVPVLATWNKENVPAVADNVDSSKIVDHRSRFSHRLESNGSLINNPGTFGPSVLAHATRPYRFKVSLRLERKGHVVSQAIAAVPVSHEGLGRYVDGQSHALHIDVPRSLLLPGGGEEYEYQKCTH